MLLTVPLKRKLPSDYMPDTLHTGTTNMSALEGLSLDRQAVFLNAVFSVTEECGLGAWGECQRAAGQRFPGVRQLPRKAPAGVGAFVENARAPI